MNRFGHNFRLAIWGESHGPQVGIAIDGVPAGLPLAEADFEADLARRRSGAPGTTPRREADRPRIVSGLYAGHTTGAPLTILFANDDTRPHDYAAPRFRPSHADWTAHRRFRRAQRPARRRTLLGPPHGTARRGGRRGEEDAARRSALRDADRVDRRLRRPGAVRRDAARRNGRGRLGGRRGRVPRDGRSGRLGRPLFDTAESLMAHLLFAVPGVRGVEFGSGFAAAAMRGSEHNDPLRDASGATTTNHAGGIVGGLTNGNELVVRVAFKPTASIARPQTTYDPATDSVRPLAIGGRHDTCIALRGAVAVEAAVAIVLADLAL